MSKPHPHHDTDQNNTEVKLEMVRNKSTKKYLNSSNTAAPSITATEPVSKTQGMVPELVHFLLLPKNQSKC